MRRVVGLGEHLLRINRLAVTLAIAVVFVAVVLGSFAIGVASLMDSTRIQARVIADNASAALAFQDRHAAGELLASLHNSPRLRAGELLGLDGSSFGRYASDQKDAAEVLPGIAGDGMRLTPFYLVMRTPVVTPGDRVGSLVLTVSLTSLYEQTAGVALITLLAALIAYWTSSLLLSRLDRPIMRPLAALNDLMARVHGAADFTVRAGKSHISELDVLGRGFNEMVEKVHDRDRRLAQLAFSDTLTGLPNRAAFMDRLEREVERAARSGTRLGLLFMDLDGFKQVNDTLGHDVGDQILVAAAARLREALRPSDTAARAETRDADHRTARLGGDEFTVLLPDLHEGGDTLVVAQRIIDAMRAPFLLAGRELILTASVGAAVFPDDSADASTLLQHADTAMYHAKRSGRNNSQMYSTALTDEAVERLDLDSSLRGALARGEFRLCYQPFVEVRTGRVHCVEALLRWDHPVRGTVPPLTFIPLAEENGVIGEIGAWVLDAACRDLAAWRAQGLDLHVAVNVSPRQITGTDLHTLVRETLARHRLAADLLELEVTEGAVVENFDLAVDTLGRLREAGVRIALDDFGTGQSSLGYLLQMPIDRIKVDRTFVGQLERNDLNTAIVQAILALAEAMQVAITAEGVETEGQARLLGRMYCHSLQGYYFSKPVAAEEIPALARRQWALDAHAAKAPSDADVFPVV